MAVCWCSPIRQVLPLVAIIMSACHVTRCDFNRNYEVSKLCASDRPLFKTIDGAVIASEMDDDVYCQMTFQTETVLQRFMIRFEILALDCNDHLYIYDGDIVSEKAKVRMEAVAGGPKINYTASLQADLSCRSTRSEIGTIFTQSNFLTLKYVTDGHSRTGDGFKLVITAYKDTMSMGCNQLRCLNTFCISKDLACDNVNHCGDDSDERGYSLCYNAQETESSVILGVDFNIFIGIVLSIFVVCLICVVQLVICLCRSNQLQQQHRIALHGQSTTTLAHPVSFNVDTAGVMMSPATTRYATLPLPEKMRDKPPPPPYNGAYGHHASPLVHSSPSNNHVPGHHVIVTDSGTNGVIPQVVYYTSK